MQIICFGRLNFLDFIASTNRIQVANHLLFSIYLIIRKLYLLQILTIAVIVKEAIVIWLIFPERLLSYDRVELRYLKFETFFCGLFPMVMVSLLTMTFAFSILIFQKVVDLKSTDLLVRPWNLLLISKRTTHHLQGRSCIRALHPSVEIGLWWSRRTAIMILSRNKIILAPTFQDVYYKSHRHFLILS